MKPHYGTKGQSTKCRKGPMNREGGGAPGQSMSKKNRPVKPHMGTQRQKKAGGASKGGSPGGTAAQR